MTLATLWKPFVLFGCACVVSYVWHHTIEAAKEAWRVSAPDPAKPATGRR